MKRSLTLLFLRSDWTDLTACLSEALAVRRQSPAAWIAPGDGVVKEFLAFKDSFLISADYWENMWLLCSGGGQIDRFVCRASSIGEE